MSDNSQKKPWPKWLIWGRDIVIFAVIISAVMAWQSKDMLDDDGSISVENQVLPDLNGQSGNILTSDKPTLLYFFAPWCKVCALSIGNLDYIDSEKVNVVTIALDYENIKDVEAFVNNHEVKSKVLLGNTKLKNEFQVQGYPSYYLVNEENQIVSRSFGYSTAAGLKLREMFGR